jgi:hypothetical protein
MDTVSLFIHLFFLFLVIINLYYKFVHTFILFIFSDYKFVLYWYALSIWTQSFVTKSIWYSFKFFFWQLFFQILSKNILKNLFFLLRIKRIYSYTRTYTHVRGKGISSAEVTAYVSSIFNVSWRILLLTLF